MLEENESNVWELDCMQTKKCKGSIAESYRQSRLYHTHTTHFLFPSFSHQLSLHVDYGTRRLSCGVWVVLTDHPPARA